MSFDSRLPRSVVFAFALLAATPPWVFADESTFVVQLRTPKGQPISEGVVSLVPLDTPPPASSPRPAEIRQVGETFHPHVTAVRVGAEVTLPNQDNVHHHVYSLSPAKKFELPLYAPGKAQAIVFDKPGVVVLGCNIHDWMLAYVVVLETPWFARSELDGTARIATPPPGRYRVEVWHPQLAQTTVRDVSLPHATLEPLEFTLALKPARRPRRAPSGPNRDY